MQIPAGVRPAIEPLPWPMRFSDGRLRMTTARMRLLQRLWRTVPGGREESQQAADAYAGGDVLDVGAFHGWYSVLLAPLGRPGDHLVSFEPDPEATTFLQAVIRDVRRAFPTLELAVVSEPVGDGSVVGVNRPAGAAGHPRFAPDGNGDSGESLTLDAYVAAHGLRPRLMKIDVEGAELSVLAGSSAILAEHRPTIMLETHPQWLPAGSTVADVEQRMHDAGYMGTTVDESATSRRQLWRPA